MDQQLELLKTDLLEKLAEVSTTELTLDRLNIILSHVDDTLTNINRVREESTFTNEEEEIYFYKIYLPEILACRIEEIMKYHIHLHIPIGTDDARIRYFEDEIRARKSFLRLNNFHYQYYRTGLPDLDRTFFLHDAPPLAVPLVDLSDLDQQQSNPMTLLFAKFMANERMQYYLLEQIAKIRHPELQHGQPSTVDSDLRWTGDAVNVVELAYGIWLTGQLNNGNASLNQIVRWLENSLQVSLGIVQRRFIEIERRKRLSITKFIDQMKDAILRKIDQNNS